MRASELEAEHFRLRGYVLPSYEDIIAGRDGDMKATGQGQGGVLDGMPKTGGTRNEMTGANGSAGGRPLTA